jgi:hypothetical protein
MPDQQSIQNNGHLPKERMFHVEQALRYHFVPRRAAAPILGPGWHNPSNIGFMFHVKQGGQKL